MKRMQLKVLNSALCGAMLLFAGATALAQKYPDKPLRMVVPFAPGGGTDVLARVLSTKLGQNLGVNIVIENRGGAGGTLGSEVVARSAPDGYTLLFTSASHVFNPGLRTKMSYDSINDFAPVTLAALVPHLLIAHPSLPIRNVRELLVLERSRPGEIAYSSGGNGSSIHLAAALFVKLAKVNMVHIPYKGGGPGMIGVLAGEASVMFPTLQSVMPHVQSGRLRSIAISTLKRSPALPEVPTVNESGLPGYDATGWYGLLVRAGTPVAAVSRLHAETVKVLNDPQMNRRLANDGAVAVGNTPAEFDKFIRDETAKWVQIIRDLKIRVD